MVKVRGKAERVNDCRWGLIGTLKTKMEPARYRALLNKRRLRRKSGLNFLARENRFTLLSCFIKCQLMSALNRRDWLRNSTLAAIGIGLGTRGFANETC